MESTTYTIAQHGWPRELRYGEPSAWQMLFSNLEIRQSLRLHSSTKYICLCAGDAGAEMTNKAAQTSVMMEEILFYIERAGIPLNTEGRDGGRALSVKQPLRQRWQ